MAHIDGLVDRLLIAVRRKYPDMDSYEQIDYINGFLRAKVGSVVAKDHYHISFRAEPSEDIIPRLRKLGRFAIDRDAFLLRGWYLCKGYAVTEEEAISAFRDCTIPSPFAEHKVTFKASGGNIYALLPVTVAAEYESVRMTIGSFNQSCDRVGLETVLNDLSRHATVKIIDPTLYRREEDDDGFGTPLKDVIRY